MVDCGSLQRINATCATAPSPPLTFDAFLAWEERQPERFELVGLEASVLLPEIDIELPMAAIHEDTELVTNAGPRA